MWAVGWLGGWALPQTPCPGTPYLRPPAPGPCPEPSAQDAAPQDPRLPDRHNFHSFFSLLGVFSLNFGGVFEAWDPQMCTFVLSSCRVKPQRPLGQSLWAPTPLGPHPPDPPHPFGPPQLGPFLFLGLDPHLSAGPQCGGVVWWSGMVGGWVLGGCPPFRTKIGQKRNWPKRGIGQKSNWPKEGVTGPPTSLWHPVRPCWI